MVPEDIDRFLAAIALGIDNARRHKLPADTPADEFAAFCVWQELRRAGYVIVPKSDLGQSHD